MNYINNLNLLNIWYFKKWSEYCGINYILGPILFVNYIKMLLVRICLGRNNLMHYNVRRFITVLYVLGNRT